MPYLRGFQIIIHHLGRVPWRDPEGDNMGCYNSCVVNAPVDEVWAAVSNFHDLSWATGVVESCEKVGDKAADQIGARRILNGVFKETLHSIDEHNHTFSYSIDDGPDAISKDKVSGYLGTVRVSAVTDGNASFVEWNSQWGDSQGGVKEFCDPIYQALLGALKKNVS